MIEIKNVSMSYGSFRALNSVTLTVGDGSIYGLIGSNGSGKSTLMRIMSGVFRANAGETEYNGKSVWENDRVKSQVVYLSDDWYFFPHDTLRETADFYASVYKNFSYERFETLTEKFGLDPQRKVNTFSKGMTKQASVILAVSCDTQYILCDETFDGLDPMVRRAVKQVIADEVAARSLTVVLSSHNLTELEDICDHVALLHRGEVILESDINDAKMNIYKVQTVLPNGTMPAGIEVLDRKDRGSLTTAIVRGSRNEIEEAFTLINPKFFEIIPLTLEEIFITEMKEAGYEIDKVI